MLQDLWLNHKLFNSSKKSSNGWVNNYSCHLFFMLKLKNKLSNGQKLIKCNPWKLKEDSKKVNKAKKLIQCNNNNNVIIQLTFFIILTVDGSTLSYKYKSGNKRNNTLNSLLKKRE